MKLICMSFDGEYQKESPTFDTTEDAWEYSNDLGSKWYFYPFHFVTTDSGLTIRDTPNELNIFNNKRVATISAMFNKESKKPENENVDSEEFMYNLMFQ